MFHRLVAALLAHAVEFVSSLCRQEAIMGHCVDFIRRYEPDQDGVGKYDAEMIKLLTNFMDQSKEDSAYGYNSMSCCVKWCMLDLSAIVLFVGTAYHFYLINVDFGFVRLDVIPLLIDASDIANHNMQFYSQLTLFAKDVMAIFDKLVWELARRRTGIQYSTLCYN